MKVLDIVLILPDGAERNVGAITRVGGDAPPNAELYARVFEGYLIDLFDAQDVAAVRLEFRQL